MERRASVKAPAAPRRTVRRPTMLEGRRKSVARRKSAVDGAARRGSSKTPLSIQQAAPGRFKRATMIDPKTGLISRPATRSDRLVFGYVGEATKLAEEEKRAKLGEHIHPKPAEYAPGERHYNPRGSMVGAAPMRASLFMGKPAGGGPICPWNAMQVMDDAAALFEGTIGRGGVIQTKKQLGLSRLQVLALMWDWWTAFYEARKKTNEEVETRMLHELHRDVHVHADLDLDAVDAVHVVYRTIFVEWARWVREEALERERRGPKGLDRASRYDQFSWSASHDRASAAAKVIDHGIFERRAATVDRADDEDRFDGSSNLAGGVEHTYATAAEANYADSARAVRGERVKICGDAAYTWVTNAYLARLHDPRRVKRVGVPLEENPYFPDESAPRPATSPAGLFEGSYESGTFDGGSSEGGGLFAPGGSLVSSLAGDATYASYQTGPRPYATRPKTTEGFGARIGSRPPGTPPTRRSTTRPRHGRTSEPPPFPVTQVDAHRAAARDDRPATAAPAAGFALPPNMPPLVLPLRLHKTLSKVDPSFRRLKRDDSHGVRLLGARGACGPVDVDDADDGYHPPAHVAVANVENPLQIPWEN